MNFSSRILPEHRGTGNINSKGKKSKASYHKFVYYLIIRIIRRLMNAMSKFGSKRANALLMNASAEEPTASAKKSRLLQRTKSWPYPAIFSSSPSSSSKSDAGDDQQPKPLDGSSKENHQADTVWKQQLPTDPLPVRSWRLPPSASDSVALTSSSSSAATSSLVRVPPHLQDLVCLDKYKPSSSSSSAAAPNRSGSTENANSRAAAAAAHAVWASLAESTDLPRPPPPDPVPRAERVCLDAGASGNRQEMCFAYAEGRVTSLKATPDGAYILAGFSSGAVKLFDLTLIGNADPEDRLGYVLGRLDATTGQGSMQLHIEIGGANFREGEHRDSHKGAGDDCSHVFAGSKIGSTKMLVVDLRSLRDLKRRRGFITTSGVSTLSHCDSRLRGFSGLSTVSCERLCDADDPGSAARMGYTARYRLLTGLGWGVYNVWDVLIDARRCADTGQLKYEVTQTCHNLTHNCHNLTRKCTPGPLVHHSHRQRQRPHDELRLPGGPWGGLRGVVPRG